MSRLWTSPGCATAAVVWTATALLAVLTAVVDAPAWAVLFATAVLSGAILAVIEWEARRPLRPPDRR